MTDSLEPIAAWMGSGRRAAMATVVAMRGASPRREGAKMWVDEEGRLLGAVTIGGCVEARVVAASERVLAEWRACTLELRLGEDDALEMGLTCGGTVEVLVEPLRLSADEPLAALYAAARAHVARGGRAAVLVRPGPAPRRLVVRDDGRALGSLGDPALDAVASARAAELTAGATRPVTLGDPQGAVELLAEVFAPAATLVVVGAGEVAVALARLAAPLALRTVVVDARERWATRERFPHAGELLVGIPSELVGALELGAESAVVLVAHDYRFDLPVLRGVLDRAVGYVGLLGSRRRGAAILGALREEGIAEERLARIHVPAGLDIGARSPAEIALSILAEALAVLRGRAGGALRERP